MRFDAPTFARAWLAVAQAAGTDPDAFTTYRTVTIEEYDRGVRLISICPTMVMSAWVPDLDHTTNEDPGDARPPALAELPAYAVSVRDVDHRAQGLLKYAVKLLSTYDKHIRDRVGLVTIDVLFDVERPEREEVLAGMEHRYAALSLPDLEQVYLERHSTEAPDWRSLFDHRGRSATIDLRLNPDVISRLATIGVHVRAPFVATLNGPTSAIGVHYESRRPIVSGLFMPMHPEAGPASDTPPEPCDLCESGKTCLRHGVGVIDVSWVVGAEPDEDDGEAP